MSDTLARSSRTRPGIPPSRAEAELDSSERTVLTGELRRHQILVDARPAERLQGSRTPVREAPNTAAGSGPVTGR